MGTETGEEQEEETEDLEQERPGGSRSRPGVVTSQGERGPRGSPLFSPQELEGRSSRHAERPNPLNSAIPVGFPPLGAGSQPDVAQMLMMQNIH